MSKSLHRQLYLWIGMLLSAAVLGVFARVLGHDFVNYDDPTYVTANPWVKAGLRGPGIAWALTSTYGANWHPMTWISHMFDVQLFGLKPWGHHLTSLLLHVANTLLLFLVLSRMTGSAWKSAFVAALFGVHPLHVESVAWVAERKDVLSTLFWLLTMWAYVRYVGSPGARRYLVVLLLFSLGLLSKPMLVTLPFVLLLLDYWPLGRMGRRTCSNPLPLRRCTGEAVSDLSRYSLLSTLSLVIEKIPLIILAAGSSIITFIAQHMGGAVSQAGALPAQIRLANALVSYIRYIAYSIWPRDLAVFYPHPGSIPAWEAATAGLVLACVTVLVIRAARSRPYLAVGWLWYIGTLVPVIGLVQVGSQAMADRYTYAPLIGLFMLLAWGIPDLVGVRQTNGRTADSENGRAEPSLPRLFSSSILPVTSCIALVALATCAYIQSGYWRNSTRLLRHTLGVTTGNYLAHNNLGVVLMEQGRSRGATRHFVASLRANSDYPEAHSNLGVILAGQGKLDEAADHYARAIRAKPDYADAHYNLGSILARRGRLQEAVEHYSRAVRVNPYYLEAQGELGNAYARLGRLDEAERQFRQVIHLKPDDAAAHYNLALVLAGKRHLGEAIHHLRESVRLRPDYVKAHKALAVALYEKGKYTEAWREVRICRELGGSLSPRFVEALSERLPEPKD